MNYINLRHLAQRGWARGIARDRLPFCEDNGDFFCALSNGRVTLWMHEEESERPSANSFAEWITDVWIGQYTFNQ
jgi:hypothetical protein